MWQTRAHIKTVPECNGKVRGKAEPIDPMLELCSGGGQHCRVLSGFNTVRKATNKDIEAMKVQTASGYKVAQIMANKLLAVNK